MIGHSIVLLPNVNHPVYCIKIRILASGRVVGKGYFLCDNMKNNFSPSLSLLWKILLRSLMLKFYLAFPPSK